MMKVLLRTRCREKGPGFGVVLALVQLAVHPVTAQNAPPVAAPDAYVVAEDQTLTVAVAEGVLSNDEDPDGDPLATLLVAAPANGTLALAADGSFVYTPNPNFNGVDEFRYRVKALPPVDPPLLFTIDESASSLRFGATVRAFGLSASDSDQSSIAGEIEADSPSELFSEIQITEQELTFTDGFDLTFSLIGVTVKLEIPAEALMMSMVSPGSAADVAADGSFSQSGNDVKVMGEGSIVFTDSTISQPFDIENTIDINGTVVRDDDRVTLEVPISFSASIEDEEQGATIDVTFEGQVVARAMAPAPQLSANVTVMIEVEAENDAPAFTTEPITEAILEEPYQYVFSALDVDGDAVAFGLPTAPAWMNLEDQGDGTGSLTGTPPADAGGEQAVVLEVTDGVLVTQQSFMLTAIAGNAPPVGIDDAYEVDEDGVLDVAAPAGVLINDTDLNEDDLTALLVDGPAHGTLDLAVDGSFRYTPDPDFSGEDAFTYQASDGELTSDATTVRLTVAPMNDPPPAVSILTPESGSVFDVAGGVNDLFVVEWETSLDPDGDEVLYTWQFSQSETFAALLAEEEVGTETRIEIGLGILSALLAANGVEPGASELFYHRVIVSDVEFSEVGEAAQVTLMRGVVTSAEDPDEVPLRFVLEQNHPNPFNPVTTIGYALPQAAQVSLRVYDVLGREVASLVEGFQRAGQYEVRFEATHLPSGLYLYRLQAGTYTETRRMVVMK